MGSMHVVRSRLGKVLVPDEVPRKDARASSAVAWSVWKRVDGFLVHGQPTV